MKYSRKSCLALLLAVVLVGLLGGSVGCGARGETAVVSATVTLSDQNVTFSYPQEYTAPPNGPNNNAITYRHFVGDPADLQADRMIFLETQPLTEDVTPESLLDQDMGTIMQSGMDFRLVKRTTLKIDGRDAFLFAFTMTFPSGPLTSQETTTWVAYLAYGDSIWQLGVMTNADLVNAAEQDFKSFTGSFKFE